MPSSRTRARATSRKFGPLKSFSQYQAPPGIYWDDDTYQGDAYGTYAWAVYVAEVAVDTSTFEISVNDFVALQEVGRVIHPVLAAGQIEGGVAQGIGYAIFENVVWRERPHGQRPDDQLHHADVGGRAAHPRVLRRDALRVRAARREGHRRAAHRRTGARGVECDRECARHRRSTRSRCCRRC